MMPDDDTKQSYSYRLTPPTSANCIPKSEFVLTCNFDRLAATYPEFGSAREQSSRQSASDPSTEFNKALTRCLLRHHFNLQLPSLPEGRLCPPVPNRANYVRWLRELIASSSRDLERFCGRSSDEVNDYTQKHCNKSEAEKADLQFRGIDIGTGVSAIYPLLLTTDLFAKSDEFRDEIKAGTHSTSSQKDHVHNSGQSINSWRFLATDIDPIAAESARRNVKANNLEQQICVVQVKSNNSAACIPNGPLSAAMAEARCNSIFLTLTSSTGNDETDLSTFPKFDFVMTNPPFYSTAEEATAPRAGDKRSRTEMTSSEATYVSKYAFDHDITRDTRANEGGDVGFIKDIMMDSQFYRNHITWYTSLVAKRSSLDTILRQLQTLDGVWGNRGQIRTVEFRQGSSSSSGGGLLGIDNERWDDPMRCSPRVRWGIAWTYERAVARCSACRIHTGLTSFVVALNENDLAINTRKEGGSDDDAAAAAYCDEVISRLTTYFNDFRTTSLKCTKRQSKRGLPACVTVTEDIPACRKIHNQGRVNDNVNLPLVGHFIIDVLVKVLSGSSAFQDGLESTNIEVSLEVYSHTKHGNSLVDKIRNPMPGEIGRTNRKWRRLNKNK
jgi:23S rRNA A1618 N6-methylase RlmF